jgi:hypothetical protein
LKKEIKILLTGCLIIALFDTIGAIASRHLTFNYTLLAAVSFLIYAVFGFIATRFNNIKSGALTAAAIGFFDSTIGWKMAMLLKANTGSIKNDPSVPVWIITIILVTAFAAICGFIGGGLSKIVTAKKSKGLF